MEDRIHLMIVTSAGTVFDDRIAEINVPLEGGSIGILADHAPLLGAVRDGVVRCIYASGKTEPVAVGIGALHVADNEVLLLVRTAERGETIDVARAKASEERARKRLSSHEAQIDRTRAEASLARAIARQDAAAFLGRR